TVVQNNLRQVHAVTGVDLSQDLLSVTAYDDRYKKRSGTIMIHVKHLDHQRLMKWFVDTHSDYKTIDHGKHTIYTWTMVNGPRAGDRIAGCLTNSTIVLSQTASKVAAALDLLDGNLKTTDQQSALVGKTELGTVLVMRGIEMGGKDSPFRSHVIRQATSIEIIGGQTSDEVFLTATMVAKSADTAQHCLKTIEGLRAMLALRSGPNDQVAQRVMKGLSVETDDTTLSVQWRLTNKEVEEIIERVTKEKAPKKSAVSTNNTGTEQEPLRKPTKAKGPVDNE
ncbi:MAG: hypothetical protein N2C12_09560, partial [Planctomycetales bacterium]